MGMLVKDMMNAVDFYKSHGVISSDVHSGDVVNAELKKLALTSMMKVNLGAEAFKKLEAEAKEQLKIASGHHMGNTDAYYNDMRQTVVPNASDAKKTDLLFDSIAYEQNAVANAGRVNSISVTPDFVSSLAPVHKKDHFPIMLALYCRDQRLRPFIPKCPTFIDNYFRDAVLPVQECGNYIEYDISVDGTITCKQDGDDPTYMKAVESSGGGICMCYWSSHLSVGATLANCLNADQFQRLLDRAGESFYRNGIVKSVFDAIDKGTKLSTDLEGPLSRNLLRKAIEQQGCDEDRCMYELAIFGKGEGIYQDIFRGARDGEDYNAASALLPYQDWGIGKYLNNDIILASAGFLIGAVGGPEFRNGFTIDFEESNRQNYRERGDIRRCTSDIEFAHKAGYAIDSDACVLRIPGSCPCPTGQA